MEKLESGLCWWNIDFNEKIGESNEQAEIRERITGPDHSRRLEGIAFGLSGLSEMCGDMNFLEEWMW